MDMGFHSQIKSVERRTTSSSTSAHLQFLLCSLEQGLPQSSEPPPMAARGAPSSMAQPTSRTPGTDSPSSPLSPGIFGLKNGGDEHGGGAAALPASLFLLPAAPRASVSLPPRRVIPRPWSRRTARQLRQTRSPEEVQAVGMSMEGSRRREGDGESAEVAADLWAPLPRQQNRQPKPANGQNRTDLIVEWPKIPGFAIRWPKPNRDQS